jgi:hypothetical protein|tara:strand:- start:4880 stop:5806 length:927 start_codon:yes stop_codon:yes gene_type:complete
MPDDKFSNLSQAEEMVPMDTEGGEVEVALPEETADEPAVVVKEVQEAQPEVSAAEQEQEQEEYSKGVQKRIDKLTAKLREAERREQAATEFANNVKQENQTLKTKTQELDSNYILAEANRVTAETEKAKADLRKANEDGDIDKQTEAQQRLAALAADASGLERANKEREATKPVEAEQAPTTETPTYEQPQYPDPDPKAETWAEDNQWFGQDRAMTMTSFAIHEDLVKEGFDPSSDEYYTEVDKRIRDEFPHKFDEDSSTKNRPVQAVASAKRSAKTGRSKSVKLTPSQVSIAKKLGVPLEEYAKYVK